MFSAKVVKVFTIFVGTIFGFSVKNYTETNKDPVPLIPQMKGLLDHDYNQQAIAKRLEAWKPGDKQNAWELSGLFEGDIMRSSAPAPKIGLVNERFRWTDGVVPYYIQLRDFSSAQRSVIISALKEFHNKTCVRFRPYKAGDKNYVVVQGSAAGCWSLVGRQYNQPQLLNLQTPSCIHHGTIVHEFMHSLGFDHEQRSPDRDQWIIIYWENIQRIFKHNFQKYGHSTVTDFGVSYDYESIMHYGPYAFSINGRPTILPKDRNARFGMTKNLSRKDITKVQRMYKSECQKRQSRSGRQDYWPLY